jgi:hypothetical protein
MPDVLTVLIVLLFLLWVTGFFVFPAVTGGTIHILLVFILAVILIKVLQGKL